MALSPNFTTPDLLAPVRKRGALTRGEGVAESFRREVLTAAGIREASRPGPDGPGPNSQHLREL